MIAHISPASMCYEESKNTLNYADRAKNIKLKVIKAYNINCCVHVQHFNFLSDYTTVISRNN